MERRDFLTGAGSVLAVGFAPPVVNLDPASLGDDPSDADIEGFLVKVDRELAQVSAKPVPGHLTGHLGAQGLPTNLMDELRRTTVLAAALQGLPPKASRHPKFAETLEPEGLRGIHAILELADAMEAMGTKQLHAIGHALRDRPRLGAQLRKEMLAHCTGSGVPKPHVLQGAKALDEVVWQLTHQSPETLVKRELGSFDKACRAAGIDRKDWRKTYGKPTKGIEPTDEPGEDDVIETKETLEAWQKVFIVSGSSLVGGLSSFAVAALTDWVVFLCVGCALTALGVILLLVGALLWAADKAGHGWE